MRITAAHVRRTYYVLGLGNTLAASLIWGVNTIFLLDAGLSNFQAFAANAFFTAGMVLFEVPTGIVADSWGRRASYLLGTVTLALTTVLYVWLWHIEGPFWAWAVSSALIGLGFTFFSGATEAWLVDALRATGDTGSLDQVFARGQVAMGVGMLVGAGGGGWLAQVAGLGAPYLVRVGVLLVTALLAGAQIVGGLVTPGLRRIFTRRTSALLVSLGLGVVAVLLIALVPNFWVVLTLWVLWGLVAAAAQPVRQAYLNGMIPSAQRATILSFDSLTASAGGVVSQPALGRAADVWGYPASLLVAAGLSALALPFVRLSRQARDPADTA